MTHNEAARTEIKCFPFNNTNLKYNFLIEIMNYNNDRYHCSVRYIGDMWGVKNYLFTNRVYKGNVRHLI